MKTKRMNIKKKKIIKNDKDRKVWPGIFIIISLFYVLFMFLLVFLIDFQGFNILGLRTWIEYNFWYTHPLFWIYFFSEGSLTEYLQWLFLMATIFFTTLLGLFRRRIESRVPWYWIGLFLGLWGMLLEDIYNIRHRLADFFISNFEEFELFPIFWDLISIRTLVELSFYFILGSLMVISFIFLLKDRKNPRFGKKVLACGYFFYFFASISSATRNIKHWYAITGEKVIESLSGGKDLSWSAGDQYFGLPLGHHFIDFLFEESLELMGATLIFAAILSLFLAEEKMIGEVKRIFQGIKNKIKKRSRVVVGLVLIFIVLIISYFVWYYTPKEGEIDIPGGGTFIGEYRGFGTFHGEGYFESVLGYTYEGEFKDGYFHGFGVMTFVNEAKYIGEFKKGFKDGEGKMVFPDGEILEGRWRRGELVEENSRD